MTTKPVQDRDIAPGYVLGYVTGFARAASREEWDREVEKNWPAFIAEMETNAGFKGAYALYTIETGKVSILGMWETLEHRLAYEAKSSGAVRAIFNALLKEGPRRYRHVVTKATWP